MCIRTKEVWWAVGFMVMDGRASRILKPQKHIYWT